MADAPFFRPHIPCAPLARFVQFIWITRGMVGHKRERVQPRSAFSG